MPFRYFPPCMPSPVLIIGDRRLVMARRIFRFHLDLLLKVALSSPGFLKAEMQPKEKQSSYLKTGNIQGILFQQIYLTENCIFCNLERITQK